MMRKITRILGIVALCLSFQTLAQNIAEDLRTHKRGDPLKSRLEIKSADGDYSMVFGGYLQTNAMFRYSPDGGKKDLDMELNAARISIYGTAFHPSLTYFFQAALERDVTHNATVTPRGVSGSANSSSSYLRDYYLNVEAHRDVQVRVGKFGMPFGRQSMALGSHMQFYNLNMATSFFLPNASGKDVGIMVHNGREEKIEWAAAALSNGVVARLGYNHNGIDGYEMSDFVGGPLRFGVAINGLAQMDYKNPDLDDLRAGMDFIVKMNHFSANGIFNHQFIKQGKDKGHNRLGAGLDLGYMMSDRYEPVLRYGWLNTAKHAHEILAGFNYYMYGQNLKLQSYAGAVLTDSKASSLLVGAQLQFAL